VPQPFGSFNEQGDGWLLPWRFLRLVLRTYRLLDGIFLRHCRLQMETDLNKGQWLDGPCSLEVLEEDVGVLLRYLCLFNMDFQSMLLAISVFIYQCLHLWSIWRLRIIQALTPLYLLSSPVERYSKLSQTDDFIALEPLVLDDVDLLQIRGLVE